MNAGFLLTEDERRRQFNPADPMGVIADVGAAYPGMPQADVVGPMMTPPPVDKSQAVADYIAQYRKAADPSAVDAAREQSQRDTTIANMGQGLAQIFSAKGQAYGGRGPDTRAFDAMRQQAQQGVETAQNERQTAIQNYLAERGMQRQDVQDQYAARANERTETEYLRKTQKGSQEAQILAKSLNKLVPGSVPDPKNVSLADLDDVQKMIGMTATIQAQKDAAHTKQMLAQGEIKRKNAEDQRKLAVISSNPGGRNPGLRSLWNQVNAVTHAEGLAFPNGQPVLDKNGQLIVNEDLTPQFVDELKQAWARVVSGGGQTSMGEREKLEWDSVDKRVNSYIQYISNNPRSAEAGNYVRMVVDSINRQKQISANQYREAVVRNYMNAPSWREADPVGWANSLYKDTTLNGVPGVDAATEIGEKGDYIPRPLAKPGEENKQGGTSGLASSGAVRKEKQKHGDTTYIYEFDANGKQVAKYPEGGSPGGGTTAQNTEKKQDDKWWVEK